MAEAVFKRENKNPAFKIKSAGIIPGTFLNEKTIATCKEIGISLQGKPQALSIPLLHWQDILVIVANNVPPSLFHQNKYGKKLMVWKVFDTSEIHKKGDKKKIQNTAREIERRVNRLLSGLEKQFKYFD